MIINDCPFLHFMVLMSSRREHWFVSPMETKEDIIPGGWFVAPVHEDGSLFQAYRFHFAIYWGDGDFLKEKNEKVLFQGIAVTIQLKNRDHLLLTFGSYANAGLAFPFDYSDRLLPSMTRDGEVLLPMLRRIARQAPKPYSGDFWHRDFANKLVMFEYADHLVFERLLDTFNISLIGCDPHTKYETRRK